MVPSVDLWLKEAKNSRKSCSTERGLKRGKYCVTLGMGGDDMNAYVTGATIRQLRERKKLTQTDLADSLGVSSKTVSKWETGRGLPDITLLEPLAKSLEVSVMELMSGETVVNKNTSCNMLRSKIYVCPICGNVIHCSGEAMISCCGIVLPSLEAEEADESHVITVENVEDEQFVTVHHHMTKEHYISFIAYVTSDRFWMTKFYPEGNAETRFQFRGRGYLYIYCNQHGLMRYKV